MAESFSAVRICSLIVLFFMPQALMPECDEWPQGYFLQQ